MLTHLQIESMLASLAERTIGLVGDLFLDRYLEIVPGVQELSIETGLEAYQIDRVRNSPGALGTVMNNLAALGVGKLIPVTVIGDDGHGYDLRCQLKNLPIDASHIIADPNRLTPTYTKPLKPTADRAREELNRLDIRTRAPISAVIADLLCEHLREVFAQVDGLIVLDQVNETNWGVVNDVVRRQIAELAQSQPSKLIFVDSRHHIGLFDGGILKGNRAELTRASGMSESSDNAIRAAEQLCRKTARPVFCTLGERGIAVARPGASTEIAGGFAVAGPIDVVGAGDSATSGIVSALLAGASDLDAAAFGNLIASITIQQIGTTGTASPQAVVDRFAEVVK